MLPAACTVLLGEIEVCHLSYSSTSSLIQRRSHLVLIFQNHLAVAAVMPSPTASRSPLSQRGPEGEGCFLNDWGPLPAGEVAEGRVRGRAGSAPYL